MGRPTKAPALAQVLALEPLTPAQVGHFCFQPRVSPCSIFFMFFQIAMPWWNAHICHLRAVIHGSTFRNESPPKLSRRKGSQLNDRWPPYVAPYLARTNGLGHLGARRILLRGHLLAISSSALHICDKSGSARGW